MKPKKQTTYDSLKAASGALKIPVHVLQSAKAKGCPGFRSNRVYAAEVLRWIEENGLGDTLVATDPKSEKLREEIRKLRIANDAREGRLVENAWVLSRFQIAAGELNGLRAKSEAEHPVRFAAAAGDVAACRTVVRGIWDDIFVTLQNTITKHLEEGPTS